MNKFSTPHNYVHSLQQIIKEIAPQCEERAMGGAVMYLYRSQALIAYKKKRNDLTIQTIGRTPRKRRTSMRPYMTILGNIRVKSDQPFPATEIRAILTERKKMIEQHPRKKSLYAYGSAKSKDGTPIPRHEVTAERIKKAENRFPALQRVTKHPKVSPWVVPVATTIEVAAGIFALLVLLPWLLSMMPDWRIPFPRIDLPAIPLPSITLPKWDLPFTMPDLPGWVDTALYWTTKTLPIWIALFFAFRAIRKKYDKNPHVKQNSEYATQTDEDEKE